MNSLCDVFERWVSPLSLRHRVIFPFLHLWGHPLSLNYRCMIFVHALVFVSPTFASMRSKSAKPVCQNCIYSPEMAIYHCCIPGCTNSNRKQKNNMKYPELADVTFRPLLPEQQRAKFTGRVMVPQCEKSEDTLGSASGASIIICNVQ